MDPASADALVVAFDSSIVSARDCKGPILLTNSEAGAAGHCLSRWCGDGECPSLGGGFSVCHRGSAQGFLRFWTPAAMGARRGRRSRAAIIRRYDKLKPLVRAHRWRRRIENGKIRSITDLADQEEVTVAFVCRLLPLTCLAPNIVTAILDGHQPKGVRLAEVLGNGLEHPAGEVGFSN